MSDITTYLNDNAQTPHGRFVVYSYTTNFVANTVTNRTDGAYALVYSTIKGERNSPVVHRQSY